MQKKNRKGLDLTTPYGVLKFPWLQKPATNFKKDGEFSCKLLLTPDDAKPLIEKLNEEFKKNLQYQAVTNDIEKIKPSDKPWKEEEDKQTGEKTGMIQFTFKAGAKRGEFDFRPKLFEANGLPFNFERTPDGEVVAKSETTPAIGSGTKAAVAFRTRGWYTEKAGAGLTLGLEAVMIKDLQVAGRNNAEEFGFSVEKDQDTQDTSDENKDY